MENFIAVFFHLCFIWDFLVTNAVQDLTGPRSILSPSNRINTAGLLTSWSIHPYGIHDLVALQVWRPVARVGMTGPSKHWLLYRLIGGVPPRNISIREQDQISNEPTEDEYIRVEKDDVIGIYFSYLIHIDCNVTSASNEEELYESQNVHSGKEERYGRFLRFPATDSGVSSCRFNNLNYHIQAQACKTIVIRMHNASEVFTHNLSRSNEPCWIFKGNLEGNIQLNIANCNLLQDLIVTNGESSTSAGLFPLCDVNQNILLFGSRNMSSIYLAFRRRLSSVFHFNVSLSSSQGVMNECQRVQTSPVGNTIKLGSATECWVITSTGSGRLSVELSVSVMDPGTGKPVCVSDVLHLRDGVDPTSPRLWLPCRSTSLLMTSGPYLSVFETTAEQKITGFLRVKSYIQDISNCTEYSVGDYEDTFVTSPGYPKPYKPHVTDCWILRTSRPGFRLLLSVLVSDLEPHQTCLSDYVEVRDGSTGRMEPLIKRWCGRTVPDQMLSSSGVLFIGFKSDRTMNHGGFKLNARLIDTSLCILYYSQFRQNLLMGSPSPDINSGGDEPTCWILTSEKQEHQIRLEIRQGREGSRIPCRCLKIRNGNFVTAPLLYDSCGNSSQGHTDKRVLKSSGSSLYVEYTLIGNKICKPDRVYYQTSRSQMNTTYPHDDTGKSTQIIRIRPGDISTADPLLSEPGAALVTALQHSTLPANQDPPNPPTSTLQPHPWTKQITLTVTLGLLAVAGLFLFGFCAVFFYVRRRVKPQDCQGRTGDGSDHNAEVCSVGTDSVLETYIANSESAVTFNVHDNEIVHDLYESERDKCGGYSNHLYGVVYGKGGKKKEMSC